MNRFPVYDYLTTPTAAGSVHFQLLDYMELQNVRHSGSAGGTAVTVNTITGAALPQSSSPASRAVSIRQTRPAPPV